MHALVGSAVGAIVPGLYLGWGSFTIQFGNLMVILLMIALFVLALVVPFPSGKKRK
jgi:hypothetical protein